MKLKLATSACFLILLAAQDPSPAQHVVADPQVQKEKIAREGRTTGWPNTLLGADTFARLGKAISHEPNFPFGGSDIEKANYYMSRLPDIVDKYNLVTGTGTKASDWIVGAQRQLDGLDPEGTASLKGTGRGNCAEFSMFFQDVLRGGGVDSQVFFGDKIGTPGTHAPGFDGTDTAIYLNETLPDGTVVRRVFDPFRATYHHFQEKLPWSKTIPRWSNRPMTAADKIPGDTELWLHQVLPPKFFVKDQNEIPLKPTTPANTTKVKLAQNYIGVYEKQGDPSFRLRTYEDAGGLGAKWIKHPWAQGKSVFINAKRKAGTGNFSTKEAFAYGGCDCPNMTRQTCSAEINFFGGGKRFSFRARVMQYWSSTATSHIPCTWATDQARKAEETVFTEVKTP